MNVVMQEYHDADRFELRIQEGAFFLADIPQENPRSVGKRINSFN